MKSEIGDGCEFGLAAVLWVVARNSTTDMLCCREVLRATTDARSRAVILSSGATSARHPSLTFPLPI